MKRTLLFSLVILFAGASAARGGWHFAWQQDPVSGDPSCSAVTDPRPAWPGVGSAETFVSLGVQADGQITIRSDPAPFALDALAAVAIAVDGHPPVSRPQASPDARTLTFSEDDSAELQNQFEQGKAVRADLVFAPSGRTVSVTFALNDYRRTAQQFKGCRGLLLNREGWLGVYLSGVGEDPAWSRWVRANTPYRSEGIRIMTVDPRKEAQKADLRPDDIILGVNGADATVSSIQRILKGLEPGSSVTLDVVRDQVLSKKTLTRPRSVRQDQQ